MSKNDNDSESANLGDRRQEAKVIDTLILNHLSQLTVLQSKELQWKKVWHICIGLLILASITAYVLMGIFLYSSTHDEPPSGDYAALVRIEGMIGADQKAAADKIGPALVRAFKDKKAKGIVLLINSPGGSPVQASLIHDRIVKLRAEYPGKKVVTVAEDMMTSAAYLIATGTTEIYVNRSTIAGSIGVIMSGFGYNNVMSKFGVERRVYTAGEHKNRFDAFKPVASDDLDKVKVVLSDMHRHFIDAVMETRSKKIKSGEKDVFSGDFWVGEKAVQMGLADGISDLPTVLKAVFNVDSTQDYTPASSFFDRLTDKIPGLTRQMMMFDSSFQMSMF